MKPQDTYMEKQGADIVTGLYATAFDTDLKTRQARELQLWKEWKASGENPEKLELLLRSYQPLIESQAGIYKGKTPLPPEAIDAQYKILFVQALRTYDPSRGAALNTHVHNQLMKGKRYVATYQNFSRIPENRVFNIGNFQRTQDTLTEELGRAPTHEELATRLDWSLKEVGRMHKEQRKDLVTSRFEEDPFASNIDDARLKEVMHMIYYEFTPEEQLVWDYSIGAHGKPKLSAGEIAQTMNISGPKVSRIRNAIKSKLERHV